MKMPWNIKKKIVVKLNKMSVEELNKIEEACSVILNLVDYDSNNVHPQEFIPVEDILVSIVGPLYLWED